MVAYCDGTDIVWGTGKAGQTGFSEGGSQHSGGTSGTTAAPQTAYILNTNTKKFHLPSCSSAKKIKDENRETWEGDREELIGQGYSPCGQCKP